MYDLLGKSFDGIKGVELIDSKKDGPTLGIAVCTHGGEVVGLDILKCLIEDINIDSKLIKGRIFLILNNIDAYKKYNALLDSGVNVTANDLVDTRFVDENMNRCCSYENLSISTSSEVKRILSLMPVLEQLDVIFDIHSTYSPSDSMSILTRKSYEEFRGVLNTEKELVGITEVQVGKPFIDIVERNGGIGIGIESGCQLDETGYKIGLDNLLRLLNHFGMINGNLEVIKKYLLESTNKQTLNIFGKIIVQGKTFKFYKDFSHLDKVKKGELFCFNGVQDLYADGDFIMVMPMNNNVDFSKIIGEEGCFMGKII